MQTKTQRLAKSAIFMALCIIATSFIKIPSIHQGYFHLGDTVILIAAWLLPFGDAFVVAAFGSLVSDLLAGYALYAPATFIAKGGMVLIVHLIRKYKKDKYRLLSGIVAELFMVFAYYLFEAILFTPSVALLTVPMNVAQGAVGLFAALLMIQTIQKMKV